MPRTAASVTEQLEDRYARGSYTILSVRGLESPEVTSYAPDVVRVGAVMNDEVALHFSEVGTASIRVREVEGSSRSIVEVAEVEGFEVVTPIPRIPNAGNMLIYPTFSVRYFDRHGRLHGVGLVETTWPRNHNRVLDVFYDDAFEPGPHEITVRVGARQSVIDFEVVAHEDVSALWLLETDLDAPNAPLRTVEGHSVVLGDSVQKQIRATSVTQGPPNRLIAARLESPAPVAAIVSLALISIGLRLPRRKPGV